MQLEDHDDGDHDDDYSYSLSDSDDDDDDWHDGAHEDTLLEDDGNDDDYSMSESGSSSNWYYGAHTANMKAAGHNCQITAGYEWCKEMHKCVRRWEVDCPSLTMSPTSAPPTKAPHRDHPSDCLITAGYEWCKEKKKCVRRWEEYCPSLTMSPTKAPPTKAPHRDHPSDCILSAGYEWCKEKQMCLRRWEDYCPSLQYSAVEQDDFSYSLSDSDDDDDDDWHDGAHDDMLKEDHDDGDHDDDDSLSDSDDDDDDWHDGAHEDTLLEDDGNDDDDGDYSMSESGSSSNWYYGAHTAIMKATGHNCLTTAGYEWCKEKKKCLRRFEEYCPSLTMSPTPQPDDGPWAPPKPGSGSARVKPTDKTEGGFVKYVFNTDDSKSSFAYRRISCDDADLCEIKCNGKFSCYKTKIDAKSAIRVTVKCNGMGACWDMDFRNTEE